MNAAERFVCHSGRLTPISGLLRDRLYWLSESGTSSVFWLKLCVAPHRLISVSSASLPIKRWRHCSFSTPLGSLSLVRAVFTGSVNRRPWTRAINTVVCTGLYGDLQIPRFEDQLWWSCVCSHRASVVAQTTSNKPGLTLCRVSRPNYKLTFSDGPFLANVNSCSCSLLVVVRPSVCLSSVVCRL